MIRWTIADSLRESNVNMAYPVATQLLGLADVNQLPASMKEIGHVTLVGLTCGMTGEALAHHQQTRGRDTMRS
ncbi:hypothetical protein [Gluconobacter sp. Gdi]|nr:hypothetical protein [Gluconobacter sp. Gdi]